MSASRFLTPHVLLFVITSSMLLSSCKKDQDPIIWRENAATNVIIDSDIGSSTDDLVAMMLLYNYAKAGKVKLLGIIVDRYDENLYNAAVVDVMNNYYGFPDLPIGVIKNDYSAQYGLDGNAPGIYNSYSQAVALIDPAFNINFSRSVPNEQLASLPDAVSLYRDLLSSAEDKSVVICSLGFLLCLSDLLESQPDRYSALPGKELVRRKVKHIYAMGGTYGSPNIKDNLEEYNFESYHQRSTQFFLQLLPREVPLTLSPAEVGSEVEYREDWIISDLAPDDPVRFIYEHLSIAEGQMMWDAVTALNIVEGDHLFDFSPMGVFRPISVTHNNDGTISYDPPKNTAHFEANGAGKTRFQKVKMDRADWGDSMVSYLREVARDEAAAHTQDGQSTTAAS